MYETMMVIFLTTLLGKKLISPTFQLDALVDAIYVLSLCKISLEVLLPAVTDGLWGNQENAFGAQK